MNPTNENAVVNSVSTTPPVMLKQIGSTTFKVAIYFSKNNTETMGDKILRLINKEVGA